MQIVMLKRDLQWEGHQLGVGYIRKYKAFWCWQQTKGAIRRQNRRKGPQKPAIWQMHSLSLSFPFLSVPYINLTQKMWNVFCFWAKQKGLTALQHPRIWAAACFTAPCLFSWWPRIKWTHLVTATNAISQGTALHWVDWRGCPRRQEGCLSRVRQADVRHEVCWRRQRPLQERLRAVPHWPCTLACPLLPRSPTFSQPSQPTLFLPPPAVEQGFWLRLHLQTLTCLCLQTKCPFISVFTRLARLLMPHQLIYMFGLRRFAENESFTVAGKASWLLIMLSRKLIVWFRSKFDLDGNVFEFHFSSGLQIEANFVGHQFCIA